VSASVSTEPNRRRTFRGAAPTSHVVSDPCNTAVLYQLTAFYIDRDGQVARAELTEPFAALLADDLIERIEAERAGTSAENEERSTPDWDLDLSSHGGSNNRTVVEVAGVEPASSKFLAGLLRAQPMVWCQVAPGHRHPGASPSSFMSSLAPRLCW
jgi:hypothetical protein